MTITKKSMFHLLIVLSVILALILSEHAFAKKGGGSGGSGGSGGGSGNSGYVIGGTGPGGGIIFHLTDDGKKGLEVSPQDLGNETWYTNGEYIMTNAVISGINGGRFNTERIIGSQGFGNYAALKAANYNGGGYGDWYLPSKDELNLIYQNLHLQGIGSFFAVYGGYGYWSSTEFGAGFAWGQIFYDGYQNATSKDYSWRVRAVRAF